MIHFDKVIIKVTGKQITDLLMLKEFILDNVRHSHLIDCEIDKGAETVGSPNMTITVGGIKTAHEVMGTVRRHIATYNPGNAEL